MKKTASKFLDTSGQSLVEVLVALTVAALVILALVVVSLMGLKNAQFAQNQAKVTKYAQEAIDQVRAIRDRNGNVTFQNNLSNPACTPCSGNTCAFSGLWSCQLTKSSGSPCTLSPGNGCYLVLSADGTSLSEPSSLNNANQNLGDGFSRQVILEDGAPALDYSKEKRVRVVVTWTDSSGTHESNVQTILTKH